jgi:hypothetical protein
MFVIFSLLGHYIFHNLTVMRSNHMELKVVSNQSKTIIRSSYNGNLWFIRSDFFLTCDGFLKSKVFLKPYIPSGCHDQALTPYHMNRHHKLMVPGHHLSDHSSTKDLLTWQQSTLGLLTGQEHRTLTSSSSQSPRLSYSSSPIQALESPPLDAHLAPGIRCRGLALRAHLDPPECVAAGFGFF